VTRYDLIRKRIAPIALVIAIGLLVRENCKQAERFHVTFVLELGAAEPRVRTIDAVIRIGGEDVATFHREALPDLQIGTPRIVASLPARTGELVIDVGLATGTAAPRRRIVRAFRAEDGAQIAVSLAEDLASP
jgi:hypothetical protein